MWGYTPLTRSSVSCLTFAECLSCKISPILKLTNRLNVIDSGCSSMFRSLCQCRCLCNIIKANFISIALFHGFAEWGVTACNQTVTLCLVKGQQKPVNRLKTCRETTNSPASTNNNCVFAFSPSGCGPEQLSESVYQQRCRAGAESHASQTPGFHYLQQRSGPVPEVPARHTR